MKPVITESHHSNEKFEDSIDISKNDRMHITVIIGHFSIKQTILFEHVDHKQSYVFKKLVRDVFVPYLGFVHLESESDGKWVLEDISKYFTKEFETLDLIFKNGKWIKNEEKKETGKQ